VCLDALATQGANDVIDMLKENDQAPQWDEAEMPAQLIEGANGVAHCSEVSANVHDIRDQQRRNECFAASSSDSAPAILAAMPRPVVRPMRPLIS
jgi:hypothetical protein